MMERKPIWISVTTSDKAVQKAFQGLEPANGDGMMMDGASADIGNKDMTMDNAAQNGATFSTEETVEAR